MSLERVFKYEGLGNDFIVVERPASQRDDVADSVLARALCDRHFGVGGDGVLFVDPLAPSMHVVNADGSTSEMCGNGLRCVALHYARREAATLEPTTLSIATGAGPHDCRIELGSGSLSEAWVSVEMAVPRLDPEHVPVMHREPLIDTPIAVGAHTVRLTGVSMGNPHAVTFDTLPAPARQQQLTLGPAVQALALFPQSVNVGFASALDMQADGLARRFKLDVYERGAGWTMACGTGACAAGVAAVLTGRAPRHTPLRFELPGGPLEITVGEPGERVRMRGPARFVFEARPSSSALGASSS